MFSRRGVSTETTPLLTVNFGNHNNMLCYQYYYVIIIYISTKYIHLPDQPGINEFHFLA